MPTVRARANTGRVPLVNVRLYLQLARASIEAAAGSRLMLVVRITGDMLLVAMEVVAPLMLLSKINTIVGWAGAEVVLLTSMARTAGNLAGIFNRSLDASTFSESVRQGRFDNILTRPVSPLGYILTSDIQLRGAGAAITGAGIMAVSGAFAGVQWTVANVAVATLAVVCCTIVMLSAYVLGAATTLWTGEGSELVNIFNYGGLTTASYPMEMYSPLMRFLFCWIVPIALTVYVPAIVLLGRHGVGVLRPQALFAVPLATAIFVGATAFVWQRGIHHHLRGNG